MSCNWVAVASGDHVARGRADGFMQVCHGKAGPLRRIRPGDRVAYYSPTRAFRGKDRLQAFTAIGVAREGAPYRADTGEGFQPFRRDISWLEAHEAPILPLREALDFTSDEPNWGYRLRFGLLPIGERDMRLIARAMEARLPD